MRQSVGLGIALVMVVNQFFAYSVLANEVYEEASGSAEIEIVDNGSGSDNDVDLIENSASETSQNNGLKLNNNIQINTGTGDNEASDNDGNVIITTGKVNSSVQVLNNLNSSYVSTMVQNPGLKSKISGNGSESVSSVDGQYPNNEEFLVNNNLTLNNNVKNYGSSGGNKASKNAGKVFISSGDVYLAAILSNQTNTNQFAQFCCLLSSL